MKKILKRLLSITIGGILLVMGTACDGNNSKKTLVLPEENEFIPLNTWNNTMLDAYLKPYWYSREIYNETAVFIGEEGESTLLFTPTEIDSVKNYTLDVVYQEGKDYIIDGNKIKRLKGSKIPYWEIDDYFLEQPNVSGVSIAADMSALDFELEGQRYLRYGETDTFTSKQIAITYRHNQLFDGTIPTAQQNKLENVLNKIKNNEPLNVMVYGDSVAVGCNASGTIYGGNINPHMPDAYNIVKQYIESVYGVDVAIENQAVGGWKLIDCFSAYNERIRGKKIDLLIFRIGGNDGHTNEATYKDLMNSFLDVFFAEYPEANVILQTPDTPNEQSTWTLNVDKIDQWTADIINEYANGDKVAIADVQSFVKWTKSKGKKARDWLANNINHANDFMIRVYAQYILKTMFGKDYIEEIYE